MITACSAAEAKTIINLTNKMNFIKYKKADVSLFAKIMFSLIVLVVLIGMWILYTKYIKQNLDQKLSCKGALGIGFGYCEAPCDPPNQPIETNDCKDQPGTICCIHLEKQQGSDLVNTGGDATHDFTVKTIGLTQGSYNDLKSLGCTGPDYNIVCKPGLQYTFDIKVDVTNGKSPLDIHLYAA